MGNLTENFSIEEFACKCGCGFDGISMDLVEKLQKIRDKTGAIVIASGCRCPEYNARVGGVPDSAHTKGLAVDISCSGSRQRYYIVNYALDEDISRLGIHNNFIHLDIDINKPLQVIFLY